MDSCLVFLLVAAVVVVYQASGQTPPCRTNDTTCLKALRDYLSRADWWFGDSYRNSCPDVSSNTNYACRNSDTEHRTIISRIFQESAYDVNNITQILRVRFYVPEGTYQACGHRFNVPAVYMSQDLDFSQVTGLDSWTTRNRPAITWDPEPGGVYTLVAYNIDQLLLAGLWVNINGGDSALGYELHPYNGPLNPLSRTSFHAFILFKQLEVISEWGFDSIRERIQHEMRNSSGLFTLNNLLDVLHISDTIGIGLMSIGPDPYAIEKYKSISLHNNCPWLIARMRPLLKKIVEVHNLTALGADVSNLEVEVEVRYTSDAVQYTSCCKNLSENARILKIDPLSQTPINPVYLRSSPVVRFAAVNMLDTMFFFNKLYTLLLLDVTWATMDPSSRQTSLLWHVTDIQGQYVTSGIAQKEYVMPIPPLDRTSNSLYVFFVLRQNGTIGNSTMDNYCSVSSVKDCDFNLYKFVQEHKLHLSGINWFWSLPDQYSRMKIYEADVTKMEAACRGTSGYGQPCPDKCAPEETTTPAKAPGIIITTTPRGDTIRTSVNWALVIIIVIVVIV